MTSKERRAQQRTNTAVEIPEDLHAAQRTTRGRNTVDQIQRDARDLSAAQRSDLRNLIKTGLERGYSREELARVVKEVRAMNREKGIK
jgi:hypothetical protein